MQNDDCIWTIIDKHFCSFKYTSDHGKCLCRNEYSVTGICNRVSCPLANSNYATVMEHQGQIYLYLKTVERAHTPAKLWERIAIPKGVQEGMDMIDKNMLNVYKGHQILRCKKKFLRIKQVLGRMKYLERTNTKPVLVTIKKKTERREAAREAKAETAAKIDLVVEQELLERLHKGVYGDIYQLDDKISISEETTEPEHEYLEEKGEEAKEQRGEIEFVSDIEELEEQVNNEDEDDEDGSSSSNSAGKKGLDSLYDRVREVLAHENDDDSDDDGNSGGGDSKYADDISIKKDCSKDVFDYYSHENDSSKDNGDDDDSSKKRGKRRRPFKIEKKRAKGRRSPIGYEEESLLN